MGDEVTMRLLGLTSGENFASNISSRLKIDSELAEKIANEIKTKILSRIPENILSEQEKKVKPALNESYAPIINTDTPIVITQETKTEALEELKHRREVAQESGAVIKPVPPNLPVLEPDFAQSTLVVKEGEKAHDVPPLGTFRKPKPTFGVKPDVAPEVSVQKPTPKENSAQSDAKPRPIANPHYSGHDPYREPIN